MQYHWTCQCCGKSFDTLPMDYAFAGPSNWFAIPDEEKPWRVKIDSNLCIIDEKEFYVRGCIDIPVAGISDHLVFGIWVSVSKETFTYILDNWSADIPEDEPARFGWLCNWVSGYPNPENIKCNVFLRSGNLRLRIVLEPTDYPLAVEQHYGISQERLREIASVSMKH